MYAVSPLGSMDDTLLNQSIESGPYPNMHKTAVVDERTSKLNQGPVILEVNTGPGRIFCPWSFLCKEQLYLSVDWSF
jgi:hypothetical protein